MSLRMKRVLITGAGRGLGLCIARQFADRGAELILTDLRSDLLEEARASFDDHGVRCRTYPLDVTDGEQITAVREQIHRDLGKIDILVNNAGVVFGGPFLDVPIDQHLTTYRVNIGGIVRMTHAFLPDLLESPRGHAVFIASLSGFVGLPNGSTYASSKWAAIGFAESIRAELKAMGRSNVGVTTVCPTYIATGMFEGAKPPKTARMLDPEQIAEKVVRAVENRKIWVLEPFIAKLTPFLAHALPTSVSDFLADAFGASHSMDAWKGHGS